MRRRSLPPEISVVVPHLNEPEDLARCLAALDRQRVAGGPDFEVIVVDNGSREPPLAVCAAYPDVRLVVERTPGPGPARSRGAAEAGAPLIAFIDADCLAQPGWIATIAQHFAVHPETDVLAGSIGIARADPARPTALELYESRYSYRVELYVERDHYAATGNMAVRKAAFDKVGPFGGIGTMEDRAWGQRATALGLGLAYVPEARVLTPACGSLAEIERRWERHIAHDFREKVTGPAAVVGWLVTSLMVAASPALEGLRLALGRRDYEFSQKFTIFGVLIRVRLYRAGRMLALLRHNRSAQIVNSWNRG